MGKKILIIVAHSDDEAIGMGGTIAKHKIKGDKVFVVSMTDGVSARNNFKNKDVANRLKAAEKSSKILGFKWFNAHNFSDNSMDKYPLLDIIKALEKDKIKLKPDLVYTHSGADLNIDHKIVSQAVLTVFRPQPNEKCKEIRFFEVASSTDYGVEAINGNFSPNLFIDISKNWQDKLTALKAYASEIRSFPHSRSLEGIKSLANRRGNQVGLSMAEAFQVIRKIED